MTCGYLPTYQALNVQNPRGRVGQMAGSDRQALKDPGKRPGSIICKQAVETDSIFTLAVAIVFQANRYQPL